MTKKLFKLISLTLIFCMLISMAVSAEELGTVRNMTYEEWLEEQESVDGSSEVMQSDLEPVKTLEDRQEPNVSNITGVYREAEKGNRLLDSILREKGEYELDGEINLDSAAENVTASITKKFDLVRDADSANDENAADAVNVAVEDGTISGNIANFADDEKPENGANSARTAPAAGLIPIIVNEDSLVNGQITTDTIIAFLYDDADADGDTIVGRYVDGNAVDFILGQIDGGFVMQITEPGTYLLIYQVEDSAGEFSRLLRVTFDVIEAPATDDYQVFEGSFSSETDTVTYNFSIDFSEMRSAAVCLVMKGYEGIGMEVFDESGNQVLLIGTGGIRAKNWGYIDKPSPDATVCNYTVEVKPNSYKNRASDYRIIIGDKKDTELMMSGIENTVLLEQYNDLGSGLQRSEYVPNVGEYWFKYRRESASVVTVLSTVTDIRFKILEADTLFEKFDSIYDSDTHKNMAGLGGWTCAEKARLTTTVGMEYYLVVYSVNPNPDLSLRTGTMGTAVGYPIMTGDSVSVSPGKEVALPSSGFSSSITFDINGDDLPNTAQVREVNLSGSSLSYVERWRMKAPNLSYWVNNKSSFWYSVDMNYKIDSSSNARLKGTWSSALEPSSAGRGKTFTPRYNFFYSYEYGD